MKCEKCRDKLADFLLDELPEREAVVVQEHLLLCPDCMARYKELKGTGRSLEAVPEFRPVEGSAQFGEQVLSAAAVESKKIIEMLPAERRLRAQTRQAARTARVRRPSAVSGRQPPASSWPLFALLLAGVAVAAGILLYPAPKTHPLSGQAGTLALAVGKVDQFYRRARESWSPAAAGTKVQLDDVFATGKDGRARFELEDGAHLFLGPSSELQFRRPKTEGRARILHLASGALELECPAPSGKDSGDQARLWRLRTPAVEVTVRRGTYLFLRASKGAQGERCDVRVVKGEAEVAYWKGKEKETLKSGQEASFWKEAKIEPRRHAPEALLPAWRADLLSNAELSRIFAGSIRVLGRTDAGLRVELRYGPGHPGALRDWSSDAAGPRLGVLANERLQVPADARFTLKAPLALPLGMEIALNAETPRASGLAFAILDDPSSQSRVSVDLDRDALLQVRQGAHHRATRVPFRAQAKAGECVRLTLTRKGHEVQARLATASGKTKPLALPKPMTHSGQVWLRAMGAGVVLEHIKISGVLPRAWLRKELAKR